MKIRFSFLNGLFLLMFWGIAIPFLFYRIIYLDHLSLLAFCRNLINTPLSSYDDYFIDLMAIIIGSFLVFVFLSILYLFFDFWGKLNYWVRYGLMMFFWFSTWVLIYYLAFLSKDLLGIYCGCGGGSPLLMSGIGLFYIPIGFVWTFVAWFIKRNIVNL